MMVNRRHDEKPLASEFEAQHLHDHRDGFDYKNAANYDQEELLFTTDRDNAEDAADGQRSGVAHENLRRITVEPEKAQPRADKRRADNGQFARERIKGNLQVFRHAKIAGSVTEQRIRKCHGDGATGRQTVQPVSEIHCIRSAVDNHHKKYEGETNNVSHKRSFDERQVERASLHFQQWIGEKQASDNCRENNLEQKFNPAVNPFGFLLRDFQIIVGEPEPAQVNHAEQREPDELIVETRPKDARNNYGANNQHAAHRRRALLHALQFGEAVDFRRSSNRLFDFQCSQLFDDEISKNQGGQKSSDRRSNGPESDVKKNVEADELSTQVMEVVHHGEITNAEF